MSSRNTVMNATPQTNRPALEAGFDIYERASTRTTVLDGMLQQTQEYCSRSWISRTPRVRASCLPSLRITTCSPRRAG